MSKEPKNVGGRPSMAKHLKQVQIRFSLPSLIASRWSGELIRQTVIDLDDDKLQLITVSKDKPINVNTEPIEPAKSIEASKPTRAINPIVAQLAASINGVSTADKPIDKDADRQPNESFQAFAARVFEVEPKPTRYTDSDQRIIDLVLKAYKHKAVNNEGRKSIEAYLNKVINDASDIFVE